MVWLLLRFALPWLLPFIVAVIVTRLIEPAVHYMTDRFRIRRGFASALCTVIVFAALIALTALIIGRSVIELTAFVKDLPSLLKSLTKTISLIGERIDGYVHAAPPEIQDYLQNAIAGLVQKIADLPASLSDDVLGLLSSIAKFTPKLILFFFTCALSVFFFSCGYKEISAFILRQIPKNRHASLRDFRKDLLATFGKWLKAELMLAGITFAEMTVAFLIMRIDFALLLALLVAIVDFLPVLGSGAFLVPWALLTLIGGNYKTAIALVVIFAVNTLVRSILEPKMIGKQIGLPALATLIAMYVGFCSVGVTGMILFPIGLIMLKHLNDKGYVKLWKN
ncbi:sporulation integral membrane protein YtvI [Sporobacter termitidis DSM 10068]|uniref:Sporulation integral membrane protein YtvI n=1 Tax=Sporobacter termitidis DSM 10068 TaxID=1123282 RepID=A0A1M5Y3C5_9FIRM|nr:sporulation integral membrane protein YtvI [Sporobacter termitidis DSM 10068]